VEIRLWDLACGTHPLDQTARATQDRGQFIDAKHRLDAGGQRSTGLGVLGLVVDGIGQPDRARIVHGELAALGEVLCRQRFHFCLPSLTLDGPECMNVFS
jgi:hypothetical protein